MGKDQRGAGKKNSTLAQGGENPATFVRTGKKLTPSVGKTGKMKGKKNIMVTMKYFTGKGVPKRKGRKIGGACYFF